jgi:hypothetical protein
VLRVSGYRMLVTADFDLDITVEGSSTGSHEEFERGRW